MKILKMISEDKITAEQGAQLLSVLTKHSDKPRPGPKRSLAGQMLRIRVTDMASGKTKVHVNLPMRLVDAGLNIAAQFTPEMEDGQMMEAVKEALSENVTGKIVDVIDEEDGEHVEIFID
ncbi:MAG: SHOCT-like domain-containing protein [Anaerolineales bacterium]